MTLNQFITNTLLEIGKDLELTKGIEKKINDYAKNLASGKGSVAISDSDVKDLIIKYANDEKVEVKAEKKEPVVESQKSVQIGLW